MTIDNQTVIDAAIEVRDRAYADYSGYRVGAAIVDDAGRLHVGCNVENASYPLGTCAETGAIAAMIAAGGRRIRTIAVAGGGETLGECTPCGGCRQRIHEFADGDTRILLFDGNLSDDNLSDSNLSDGNGWRSWSIEALLPNGFTLP